MAKALHLYGGALFLSLVAAPIFALDDILQSPKPEQITSKALTESDDIEARVLASEDRIEHLQKQLREKIRQLYRIDNSASPRVFPWEADVEPRASLKKRRILLKMLNVTIRSHLKEIEELSQKVSELKSEQAWIALQKEQQLALQNLDSSFAKALQDTAGEAKVAEMKCAFFPVEAAANSHLKLMKDFGKIRDAATGLEWNSTGWWIGPLTGEVKTCAAGTVAFVGKVTGRGRVVMIDHGVGTLTIYANLAESGPILSQGQKLASGAVIGTTQAKLYFEVRKAGIAVNPREIISPEILARLSLQ